MTPYDMAMAAVIVAGMIWGAWRGITWQLATILSLVLGYAVAVPSSAKLAPHFPGEPIVARALAMLALYVAVSAAVFGVAWSIRATLKRWKFEAFDRHLGMMLGGFNGALVGVVATLFVISLAPQSRSPILKSLSGQVVDQVLQTARPALPAEVSRMLAPFWEEQGVGTPDAAIDWASMIDPEPEADAEAAPVAERPASSDRPKADRGLLRSFLERQGAEVGRAVADQIQDHSGGRPDSARDDDRAFRR